MDKPVDLELGATIEVGTPAGAPTRTEQGAWTLVVHPRTIRDQKKQARRRAWYKTREMALQRRVLPDQRTLPERRQAGRWSTGRCPGGQRRPTYGTNGQRLPMGHPSGPPAMPRPIGLLPGGCPDGQWGAGCPNGQSLSGGRPDGQLAAWRPDGLRPNGHWNYRHPPSRRTTVPQRLLSEWTLAA